MAKLKCIIFDIDGTLTQTNELIFATFNYVAKKYLGKTFTPNEITAMFGPPEEVAIQQFVGEERFPLAMADFFDFYKSNFRSLARAYPGVIEILDFLKGKNIILAVFTGKGLHSTEITLEQLGITDYVFHNVTELSAWLKKTLV